MRIGTSRADRYGFAVFVVLASLLAVLLVTSLGDDTTDSAQEVSTFADVAPPTAVPTTVAVSMPEPTPTATPTPDPTPVPVEPASAPEDEDEDEEVEADADESSTADSSGSDAGTTSTASAGTSESSTAAAAPAAESTGGSVPNPQAPAATAIPNPQPATSPVPNPQPATSPVPNPQPGTQQASAPANVPADAPAGGTFTRTLAAKNTGSIYNVPLYSSPGGSQFMPSFNGQSLPAQQPTVFGNTLVYRVLAGEPGDTWAKVYVPARPNGTVAWVQTSYFNWGSSNQLLQIDISNNTVTLFEGSNVLITTAAVTGKSTSRTPRANGWVEEIMAGPSSAYGPRLISLGIFSDDLNSFGSRNAIPKIALHGTNNPGLMGQYASNGCIRVPNDVISAIASRVIPGSKVIIVG